MENCSTEASAQRWLSCACTAPTTLPRSSSTEFPSGPERPPCCCSPFGCGASETRGENTGWEAQTPAKAQSQSHTDKDAGGQFRVPNSPQLHLLGLWEEAGENARRHRKNIQSQESEHLALTMAPSAHIRLFKNAQKLAPWSQNLVQKKKNDTAIDRARRCEGVMSNMLLMWPEAVVASFVVVLKK